MRVAAEGLDPVVEVVGRDAEEVGSLLVAARWENDQSEDSEKKLETDHWRGFWRSEEGRERFNVIV